MAKSTKPGAEVAAATADYEVISPLDHDGVRYAIGARVALTEAQAAALLGHTVQEPQPEAPADPAGQQDPPPEA